MTTVDEPAGRDLPRWLASAVVHPSPAPATPPGVRTMEYGHNSPLQIDVSWDGVGATVTVTGELDITTATALTGRLLAVVAEHPERLVLDLSGLAYIDVAGART